MALCNHSIGTTSARSSSLMVSISSSLFVLSKDVKDASERSEVIAEPREASDFLRTSRLGPASKLITCAP